MCQKILSFSFSKIIKQEDEEEILSNFPSNFEQEMQVTAAPISSHLPPVRRCLSPPSIQSSSAARTFISSSLSVPNSTFSSVPDLILSSMSNRSSSLIQSSSSAHRNQETFPSANPSLQSPSSSSISQLNRVTNPSLNSHHVNPTSSIRVSHLNPVTIQSSISHPNSSSGKSVKVGPAQTSPNFSCSKRKVDGDKGGEKRSKNENQSSKDVVVAFDTNVLANDVNNPDSERYFRHIF